MELLYVIGFFVLLWFIVWVAKKLYEFVQTAKYKKKLRRLAPQLESIKVNQLFSKLSEVKEAHQQLSEILYCRYRISCDEEHVKVIEEYVKEEANYRRSKRKPARRKSRVRYYRYGRY
jgi:hypothetical protein